MRSPTTSAERTLRLSLERLDALVCGENRLSPGAFITGLMRAPQRIGLSATQNPIELVAEFLTGSGSAPRAGDDRAGWAEAWRWTSPSRFRADELTSVTSQVDVGRDFRQTRGMY